MEESTLITCPECGNEFMPKEERVYEIEDFHTITCPCCGVILEIYTNIRYKLEVSTEK